MLKEVQSRGPQIVAGQPHGPAAVITRRAADRLRAGHLWVYSSDVASLIPHSDSSEIAPGALSPSPTAAESRWAQPSTARRRRSRCGWSPSKQPSRGPPIWSNYRSSAISALALRNELAPSSASDNSCRLIFSEADNLPGIVADRYNDLVILQLLTQGTAQDDVRRILAEVFANTCIPPLSSSGPTQRFANWSSWPLHHRRRSTPATPIRRN